MYPPGHRTAAGWLLFPIAHSDQNLVPSNTSALPVDLVLPDIIAGLTASDSLILAAPPGAGKTTRVPLALLKAQVFTGKILLLEPRRMAAKAVASRMASQLGERLGQTVGLRIRQETKAGPDTKIEVITGGVLQRMLLADPSLAGVSLVIFDELHERSLDTDLGLALVHQGRTLLRDAADPLKILAMSATLELERIRAFLADAPVVESVGRQFPVSISYRPPTTPADWLNHTRRQVLRALDEHEGSLLVFLPGQKEINALRRQLEADLPASVALAPLYGSLSLQEQQRAMAPLPAAGVPTRKVVLATDIAETSLTIEGISVVIDSGYRRAPIFAVRNGMTRLSTQRISQASAAQRAGRAGRLAAGHCYRLWQESLQLEAFAQPEILQADLAPLALQLLAFGVNQPAELQWLTPPPAAAYQQALGLLRELGAITGRPQSPRLSSHGQAMAEFPAHPRLAHMMLAGGRRGLARDACLLASLLAEPNRPRSGGADLEPLLVGLRAGRQTRDPWTERVVRQADSFMQLLPKPGVAEGQVPEQQRAGYLVALAYPDRLAVQRGGIMGLYRLSQGRAARLHQGDALGTKPWLAVADLGGSSEQNEDQIFAACAFDPALFTSHFHEQLVEQETAVWDEGKARFVAERRVYYGELLLKSEPLGKLEPARRQSAVTAYVQKAGLACLGWRDDDLQWRARVDLLARTEGCGLDGHDWPDLSDQALLARLPDWLTPALTEVQNLADLQKIRLKPLLEHLLSWPLQQKLNEWAPARLEAPSGSPVSLDYCQSPPVMAVKLQEMFGQQETPKIARGKVAVLIHLLSPGGQPLQITQDLAHFWQHGYAQVKKEMKGRYPRHPWPDDPLRATPTRMTKKQLQRTGTPPEARRS